MSNAPTKNGYGVLRAILEAAHEANGCSRNDLTVLSAQVDPYRLDTPAGHRDGKWAAEHLEHLWSPRKQVHWRGLHYAIVQSKEKFRKPNGELFENTEEDWIWLSEVACKAARWLGYIPFDRVIDRRNSDPVVHKRAHIPPETWMQVGVDVVLPDADDIRPQPRANGFVPRQAYQFVIFGEKSSLEDALLPLAKKYETDLYLPTGEISDTLLFRISKDASEDGRPLVMFTISDCDPSGHQMPVSIARKLQAFRDLQFPNLRFEVVPVALTPEQVRDLGLPSKPLKEGEKRASRWKAAFGIEQTEIDALTTPTKERELRRIVERAFNPYFDHTLEARVEAAADEWQRAADEAMSTQVDEKLISDLRKQAEPKLNKLRTEISRINRKLRLATSDHVTLPDVVVPEAKVDAKTKRQALVSLDRDWVEATRALVAHKAYGGDTP